MAGEMIDYSYHNKKSFKLIFTHFFQLPIPFTITSTMKHVEFQLFLKKKLMGISFFVLCCVSFCSSNWLAEQHFFSEKTVNWHGFSNIF
jgi:hypothetical protein